MRWISMLIIIASLALVVFGWFVALGVHTVAESNLEDARNTRADLTAEVASYDYVGVAKLQHETGMTAQAWAGATDVQWDDYLAAIASAMPAGVQLSQIQMTQASPQTGFNLNSGTPFAQTDLGQLSISGSATSPALVADAITSLSAVSGLSEVTFGSSRIEQVAESDAPVWTFDITARVTLNALSGRLVIPEDVSGDNATTDAEGETGA